jgi:DNA polymerase epsilon subunit 2
MVQVQKTIFRAFKLNGLTMQVDAVNALASVLNQEEDVPAALENVIAALKSRIERRELTSNVITLATITAVIDDLQQDDADFVQDSIRVFDAFQQPVLKYNVVRKTFYVEPVGRPCLHAEAVARPGMFRNRFVAVQQRAMRNKHFKVPLLPGKRANIFELAPLESLLGSSGSKQVLGMIVQKEEGCYYLEDLTSSLRADFSAAQTVAGLFTEGCIVLCEGEVRDDVLYVKTMGFPPPEKREATMSVYRDLDYLGTGNTPQQTRHLKELGSSEVAADCSFVIVSDVHLDKPMVFDKLEQMFRGFAEADMHPELYVLIGNFTSQPIGHGSAGVQDLIRHFDQLCTLITSIPGVAQNSRFVFVPGPTDPGAGDVLPRPGLPKYFTQKLRSKLPNAVFSSNPCRITFYAQEIVIFRADLLHQLRRSTVVPVSDLEDAAEMDITEHLVKTVLDQGHLCPLPLAARPVYWSHDHALRLDPLPDVLILADHTDQYSWTYEDCSVFNPSSFATDFSFVVYRPATKDTEYSRVQ